MGATKKTFEELHPEWEYECDLYAQQRAQKLQEESAWEIAFGNIRQDEEVEVRSDR